MTNILRGTFVLVLLAALPGSILTAQTPLAAPLAEFDKLVAQLTTSTVFGEPVRAGNVTVLPYGAVHFGLTSAGVAVGFGGGMSGRIVPMGVVIVEGDDVHVEQIPEQQGEPSLIQGLLEAIRDRKVVIMGNGLNVGQAPGTLEEMAPLFSAMMGATTVIGNALNLGKLSAPASAASPVPAASIGELKSLFEAKDYTAALAMVGVLLAKDPNSAELESWKVRILENMAPPSSAATPR
jgi:uncharacterized spore protein YtfJ